MTPQEILDLPMKPNDANAATIRDYLKALLLTLWEEQEGFSGKRPFGNGGWSLDMLIPLIKAGMISGTFDDYGYIEDCDEKTGSAIIAGVIAAL